MSISAPTVMTGSTIADDTDNPTTYDSGANWQAIANTLYVMWVGWSFGSGAGTAPTSVTGGGLTFTPVTGGKKTSPVSGANRVGSWYYASSSSPGAAAHTVITRGSANMTGCAAFALELVGALATGTNGVNGVVQAATAAEDAVTTFASPATLAGFADVTNNLTLAGLLIASSADTQTAGSGFTLVGSQACTVSPAFRVRAQYKAGQQLTVNFTNSASRSLACVALEIAAAPTATQLAITTQPAGAVDATNLATQPAIQLKDVNGNNSAQSGVTVTAAVQTGTGTAAGGTTAVTDANGLATFATLKINGYGNHTLRFTATSLTSVDSATFFVSGAGPATKVVFSVQPSNTQADTAISPVVKVKLQNASSQDFYNASVNITVARGTLLPAPLGGAGTLNGTLTQATSATGESSFSGINMSLTGGADIFTLHATSAGLTAADSNEFAVYPAGGPRCILGDGTGILG